MQVINGLRYIDNFVGRITCEDNVPVTLPLPRKFFLSQIMLRLYGKITIATAAATGKPDLSPFSLLKLIRVSAGGRHVIKSFTGQDLQIINTRRHKTLPSVTAPGLTVATHEFEGLLLINMAEVADRIPIDTLFNATGLEIFFLEITWGTKTDVVIPDATTVLSWNVTPYIDVSVVQPFGNLPDPRVLNMEYTSEKGVTEDSDLFEIPLNGGHFYRFITLVARDAGVRENDIIENITLKSGNEEFVNNLPARTLQLNNKSEYGLESVVDGVYFLNLAKYGSLKDCLDARKLTDLKLVLKVKKGTGTTKIRRIVQEYIMPQA